MTRTEETTGTVTFNFGPSPFKIGTEPLAILKDPTRNRQLVVIIQDGPGLTHYYLL